MKHIQLIGNIIASFYESILDLLFTFLLWSFDQSPVILPKSQFLKKYVKILQSFRLGASLIDKSYIELGR